MKLEQILLRCFSQIQGERSPSNVYHLLKGKRSIQTIQDAHLFKLNRYYGIYKNISKQDFDWQVHTLITKNLITQIDDEPSSFRITNQGRKWLDTNTNELYFNGLAYLGKADTFMERLILLIQTLTNSKMNFFGFIPVIHNQSVEQWVKNVYRNVKGSEKIYLSQLYEELQRILISFSKEEASMFVDRLSGFQTYGLTLYQMEERYQLSKGDVHIIFESMAHRMIHTIEQDYAAYPTLSLLIDHDAENSCLTHSAKQTYSYFLKGYTVEQIAKRRRLKENTIHDHLVEIAFYSEDFPLRNYVTAKEQQEILDAMKKAESQRLKHIKDCLNDQISYFQIRLVIAVENKRK